MQRGWGSGQCSPRLGYRQFGCVSPTSPGHQPLLQVADLFHMDQSRDRKQWAHLGQAPLGMSRWQEVHIRLQEKDACLTGHLSGAHSSNWPLGSQDADDFSQVPAVYPHPLEEAVIWVHPKSGHWEPVARWAIAKARASLSLCRCSGSVQS